MISFRYFDLAYTGNIFPFVYECVDLIFSVFSKLTGLDTEAMEEEIYFGTALGEMLILFNDIVNFGYSLMFPCRVIYHCRS